MKVGRLIPVAAFLTATSAWADVAPPFSASEVSKLDLQADYVDGDKIKSSKYTADDLAMAMCDRELEKNEVLAAVIPCPATDLLEFATFDLAVYDKKTGQESSDCPRVPVTLTNAIAAPDAATPANISANIAIHFGTLDLAGNANMKVKEVKDKKSPLNGLSCVNGVKGNTGTGLVDGDPISKFNLKIGKVKGGTTYVVD